MSWLFYLTIFTFSSDSLASITLEGRVVRKPQTRNQSVPSIGSQKQFNDLVRRSIDQANTSTSTSTTHSPPPEDSTCYASLTNVNLTDCVESDGTEYKQIYQLQETKYIIVDQNGWVALKVALKRLFIKNDAF